MKIKLCLLIFPLIICIFLSGCMPLGLMLTTVVTDEEIAAEQEAISKIGFSKSEDNHIDYIMLPSELKAWENPYKEYFSYYFYNRLSDNNKLIYKALEFALVNQYTLTHIDYRIDSSSDELLTILDYLSLDTPLLEQNLISAATEEANFYNYQYNEERVVEVIHRGSTIYCKNFGYELWSKKLTAIDEARRVYEKIDKNLTDAQLAEELYRYIAGNVEYIPYEDDSGIYEGDLANFLYDAFINKKTHCDGFSNSLALLFEIAGFEQVEKVGYSTEAGHTWNCVKIGDEWYNCDATSGKNFLDELCDNGAGLGFAFSDTLESYTPLYKTQYPSCNKSLYLNVDIELPDLDYEGLYDEIRKGFEKHNNEWTLIVIWDYEDEKLQDILNNLAYEYYTDIYCRKFDLYDNSKALLITTININKN